MRHDEILGLLRYLSAPGERPALAALELAFWLVVLICAALLMWLRPIWIVRAEDTLRRFSQHRRACVLGIGGAVLLIRLALLPLVPVPVPYMLDEFSYLLGADTFASGRLTNATPPMWLYFESININVHPTYQSMYPPAQAMVLALGQKLFASPWAGVLLSAAVMCAVFCWMLQGWLPPQWALLGGIFAVLRYGIFSYWINSYWGGAVAAIGGALLLGALPRMRQRLTLGNGLLFSAGLVILANSRPFEGLLFALPLAVAILSAFARSPLAFRRRVAIALPMLALLAVTAAAMLFYNWRSTGNALLMPYSANQATYHLSRPFLFQKPYPTPSFHSPELRAFYMRHELPDLLRSHSLWGIEELLSEKLLDAYAFMLWPLLLLFIAGFITAAAARGLRVVAISITLVAAGLAVQLWPFHGHYAAPASGAVLLCLLLALRRLRAAPGSQWRLWLSRASVGCILCWMLVPIADRIWDPYSIEVSGRGVLPIPRSIDRARIESQLERTPGQHLVLVHSRRSELPGSEWVYNRADINNAKVVWARDMGEAADQPLLRYFAGRTVWYVDRGQGSLLVPYESARAVTDPARTVLPDASQAKSLALR